jgi:LysR family transcriptional regulator, carnitine catabolism transcriptional activator
MVAAASASGEQPRAVGWPTQLLAGERPSMDRRHLDYFLAVADYGGFTNASHVLRIAQPSLSQAIKSLEAELGVQLFDRLPQGTRLTSAGEALIGPARQTLRDFAAAHAAVTKVRQVEAGRLDIAALPGLAPLAPLFGRFHIAYPDVTIRITDPRGADILGLVRSGEVDLALALTAKPTPELAVVELPGTRILVALPPGSSHEPGSVVTGSELEEIGLVEGTTSKQLVLAKLADIGVTPTITVETDHREALLPLVLQGCGACLVAESMADDAAARGAVLCRLDPEPAPHKQVLVHRRADVPPAASAFVSTVAPASAVS